MALTTLFMSSRVAFGASPTPDAIKAVGDKVSALEQRAATLGIPDTSKLPDIDHSALTPENWYRECAARLLRLMQRELEANRPDLITEAADLLAEITAIERSPSEYFSSTRAKAPSFSSTKARYRKLFDDCQVRDKYTSTVNWYIDLIRLNKARYEEVAIASGVPWHFLAVIHGLEASFNFRTHLHNGDLLSARTVHVPAGRPSSGQPPFTWNDSAADALALMNYAGKKDWSLERTLYRLEAYNGWGYRPKRIAINSPYLWSFSQHYTKGKYASDGAYDSSLVSQQCGAAVLLKVLTTTGDISW
ncbi:hypothetical protein ACFWXH_04725 [Mesorhizobium sp. NPDC059054]|uniref:hypothetical protein n=1 Tax=Mesorhizobium sp. NPDC059054 TaxID=3346711 RepID=UPI00367AEE8F